jgi:hypothetical protein
MSEVQAPLQQQEEPSVSSVDMKVDDDEDEKYCYLGVSVHYLHNHFMMEVEKGGFSKSSKIYELENL